MRSAELLRQAADAGLLAPPIATNLVRTLVGGGTDTTISGIGFTLKHLAENPEQWAAVKAEPTLVRGAFEEALRLDRVVRVGPIGVGDEIEPGLPERLVLVFGVYQ